MNTVTARALSLALAVAIWATISHLARVPLQLWPVIVGLGCFLAAGGGIPGLQKSIASTVSGVVWVLLYVTVSRSLGREVIVDALVLGAAVFGIVLQTRIPLLSYVPGAIAGAGVTMGALGVRSANVQGGVRLAIALAVGAVLGYAAEWLTARIRPRTA
ncbi:MAG TPA: DUF1097 domain-containing protein [Myxococcales bacterium]|nr:DUF1097 domain-containing protein [Myxococcales bacterium]